MADPTQIEVPGRIYWRYQDARSNKDYITSLERVGDLWIANYAFGAHGATLKPGTKMSKGPGTYAQARKVYDAMVKERLAKGYKPQDGEGSAYVADPGGQRHSGIQCQLLNPIGEDEAQALIGDDGWFSQEKHDGKRMLIRKAGQEVCGINRRGLLVGFPKAVEQAALAIPHDFVIDGEAIGERLHAFDVLEAFGADQRALGAYERLSVLRRLLEGCGEGAISFSTPAVTTGEKQALHDRLLAARREGLVFKRKRRQPTQAEILRDGVVRRRGGQRPAQHRRHGLAACRRRRGMDPGGQLHHPVQPQSPGRGCRRRNPLPPRLSRRWPPGAGLSRRQDGHRRGRMHR